MYEFDCPHCQTRLSAAPAQVGQRVQCPGCMSTIVVPGAVATPAKPVMAMAAASSTAPRSYAPDPPRPAPAPAPPPTWQRPAGIGRRYGFNCGYCSSRLEATEAQAGTEGECPTCGNRITIPILDRFGRLIDPTTNKIIKPDPHPVHAYAAAGDRAPGLLRAANGALSIKCPKCGAVSNVDANNCRACGTPFTMEGTTLEAHGVQNSLAVGSLVLGVLGIPLGCTVILPVLALVFGIIGLIQVNQGKGKGRGLAIAGIACGSIGCVIAVNVLLK